MKYIKKPVEVEAVQWNGKNINEVLEFTNNAAKFKNGKMQISTLEGIMTASVGDYVVKGVKDEFYPCKPDIFNATYASVEEHIVSREDVKAEIVTQSGETRLYIDGEEIANVLKLRFCHNPLKKDQPELQYTTEIDVFKK